MNAVKTTSKPIIFVTGHSGMLGQSIADKLADSFQIHGLIRTTDSLTNPTWNYIESLNKLNIKAPHAVIHLAGAGTADKRWTDSYKKTLIQSRVNGTQWLVSEIMQQQIQPEIFLCASAIGFYGDRPGEPLTEESTSGDNFVAELARQWEAATGILNSSQTRVINLRFGMVLSSTGGALKNMLTPFKMALGGRIGHGQQHYSWIGIDDAVKAIKFLMEHPSTSGVYNLTTPNPVTNQEFTQSLASSLNRPAFIPMPAFVARLVFGQMADELLLADTRVLPNKLVQAGFEFSHPQLKSALNKILQ